MRLHSGVITIQGNPSFPHLLQIWYPAASTAPDAPVADDGSPHPVIFFQHAGGSHYTWYDFQFERLASRGFIVVSIGHDHAACPGEFWECHRQLFGGTIDRVVEDWNTDPDHFLFEHVDVDRMSLAGHSHGAAFISVRDYRPMNPDARYAIQSVCLIAPCPEVPIADYLDTYTGMPPLQVIYGSKDEDGCTSGGQGVAIFETASRPRHHLYVVGANHYVFCEGASLGESTITRLDAWRISAAAMAAFHALILHGDVSALPALRGHVPLIAGGPETRAQFLEPASLVIDDFEDLGPGHGVAMAGLPGQTIVNGFLGDTFVDFEAGVTLLRTQIRSLLSPAGGPYDVLLYEDFALGPDVYLEATSREVTAGLIGALSMHSDSAAFAAQIDGAWDLVIMARQNGSSSDVLPHDTPLRDYICAGGKAILSDFRINSPTAAATLLCAGAPHDGTTNFSEMTSTGPFFGGTLFLQNPGWGIWTYGLAPADDAVVYATNELPGAGGGDPHVSALGLPVEAIEMAFFEQSWMLAPTRTLYHPTTGLEFAWTSPDAAFAHHLAPGGGPGLDARRWRDLSFRIVQIFDDPLNPGTPIDLHVVLEDGNGDVAALALSDAPQGPLRFAVPPASGTGWKSILETYRFPLADFRARNPALDLDDLHTLGFLCDVTPTGRCLIDDLEFANEAAGADLDADGDVDFSDLLILLAAWGPCPPPMSACAADIDGDGSVGFADLLTLLAAWG